jgi:hypothetical protein
MQIIPETGADVASRMGWPLSFEPDMLYRPIVSVKLGTYYLASNRVYLNGDLYAALAAYNAGPGNALAWQGLAGDDPDLLLEVVRPEETRNYIRGIYEIYNIYRSLYSPRSIKKVERDIISLYQIYPPAAFSAAGSNPAASIICSVEHENAKRMCPAPAAPKADPGEEPTATRSIR